MVMVHRIKYNRMARCRVVFALAATVSRSFAWCPLLAVQSLLPVSPANAITPAAQPVTEETSTTVADLQNTASQAEQYINEHLFDPDGLMYSYIDVRTGEPFEEDYVAHFRENIRRAESWSVHHRADSDPVTYWSYEDTIATAGYYIEALVLKHELTGDAAALERAFEIWNRYKLVYYASQVYGIGSFLRPYGGFAGGFAGMSRWMEPLGTDQASPLLCGQYALWKHAKGD